MSIEIEYGVFETYFVGNFFICLYNIVVLLLNKGRKLAESNQNIHAAHRKRVKEKFLKTGFAGFAEHEILEMMLFFAIPYADTNPLAHELIKKFGSIDKVFDAEFEQLIEVPGVGEHTALLIKLFPAIFNIYSKSKTQSLKRISGFSQAINFSKLLFAGLSNEVLFVICLDAKSNVVATKQIASGTFDKATVVIRDITNFVLKNNCSRIIVTHNHPQGNSIPSDEDVLFTNKLFYSCLLNDIDILDHIIIGKESSFSFAHEQLLFEIKKQVFNHFNIDKENAIFKRCCVSENKDPYIAN